MTRSLSVKVKCMFTVFLKQLIKYYKYYFQVCEHESLTRGWFTAGTPSGTLSNSKPTLGEHLVFAGIYCETSEKNAGVCVDVYL